MSTITQILIVAALVLSIFVPFSAFLIGERNKGRLKTSLAINAFLFFGIFAVAGIVSLGNGASALAAEAASESSAGLATGLGYLAAALVSAVVSQLPVLPALPLEQSARIRAFLVNLLSS